MDGARFDRVTRALTSSVTRRRALAGLFGVAVASAGGDASAAVRGRPCQRLGVQCTRDGQCCSGICRTESLPGRRRRQVCGCPSGLHACRGQCVNLLTDPTNCGACGEVCDGGECIAGVCPGPSVCDGIPCPIDPAIGADVCIIVADGCQKILAGAGGWAGNSGDPTYACTTDSDCSAYVDQGLPNYACAWVENDPGAYTSPGSPYCYNYDPSFE